MAPRRPIHCSGVVVVLDVEAAVVPAERADQVRQLGDVHGVEGDAAALDQRQDGFDV